MRLAIITAVVLTSAVSNVPSLDAAQKCGSLSMDPACAKPSPPRPNVTFGQSKPAPVVPLPAPEASQLAPIQELRAAWIDAMRPAIDCKMVIVPRAQAQGKMPVVRPAPDVSFSMRVVTPEKCDAARR